MPLAKFWINAFVVVFFAMSVAACGETRLKPIDAGSSTDWKLARPEQVGFDAAELERARAYAFRKEFYTQGIVIIKDGYLAAEWYGEAADQHSYATSWSVAKSFTSALIGIAVDRGLIASVDQSMATFIPAWQGSEKAAIRLRDVLAMSSGLDWIEDYENIGVGDQASDVVRLVLEADPMAVAFDQPLTHAPGEVWNYSSGDTMLLGHVLKTVVGVTAADWAKEVLANPLGFSRFAWWQDATGNTNTYCCVDTTSRDFARFGQLFLQKGIWGGQQLISQAWVAASTSPQAKANAGYGYQWWLNHPSGIDRWPSLPASTYFALGHNGQYIAVFPEQNLVVVRNGQYKLPKGTDWIAEAGLFAGGMFSDRLGPTGTRAPEGEWSEDYFFRLILDAISD